MQMVEYGARDGAKKDTMQTLLTPKLLITGPCQHRPKTGGDPNLRKDF